MIGKTFGNYRILEKRGEGGMGMFFRATDLHLDRIVGLKTLRTELLADPDLRERLHTEARSLARLVHQNIANVLHYLVEDDYHFIVMEFVDGRDLGEIIKKSGLIPIDQLALIIPQIFAAVAYAHTKGVIHRDLKPSNIMLTGAGEVKVTDFGIAKILGAQSQTRTGVAPGSLHYMAPEQISGGPIDQRSDIYQLGAMLYELYTGRKPFVSDNEYELMTMHLNDVPAVPSTVNPRVPPGMDAVIMTALAKKPEDRYQSVGELSAAFTNAAQSASSTGVSDKTEYAPAIKRQVPAGSVAGTTPTRKHSLQPATPDPSRRMEQPTPLTPKRSTAKIVWGGVVVVVIFVVGALLWLQREQKPEPPVTQAPGPEPMCTLTVSADLPAEVRVSELQSIRLTLVHADSGESSFDVAAPGNHIEETYTIVPTSSVSVEIVGTDTGGHDVLNGTGSVRAPAGVANTHIALNYTPVKVPEPPPSKPTHNLVLNVTPFTAKPSIDRIWIDDKEVTFNDDFKFTIKSGNHMVRLGMGNDRLTDLVTVPEGETVEKSIFLGAGRGRLSLGAVFPEGVGYAQIWIDGVEQKDVGTPTVIDGLLEGPHFVEVRAEGYRPRGGGQIVTIAANSKSEISFEMIRE